MKFLQLLQEFYQNNKDLSIALLGLIVGAFLSKFLPTAVNSVRKGIVWIGGRIGGRLAFKSIESRYLNWVVLQNQDLNLTGIIGSGPKPKLEQIFISLKVVEQGRGKDEESKVRDENNSAENLSEFTPIRRIWIKIFSTVRKLIQRVKEEKYFSNGKPYRISIYHPVRLWQIRQIFNRDGFSDALGLFFIAIFFLILPSAILLLNTNTPIILISLSNLLLSIVSTLTISAFISGWRKLTDGDDIIFGTIFFITPLTVLITCTLTSPFETGRIFAVGVGVLVGILLGIVIINKIQKDSEHHPKEETAQDLGKIFIDHDRIAILGKPGSGKSTILQYLALTFAQEKALDKSLHRRGIAKKRLKSKIWFLPILVPLRKIAVYLKRATNDDRKNNLLLEAYRQEVLPSEIRDTLSIDYIRHMLRKKRCVLLLDGLDEVTNDEVFRTIINEVKGLMAEFPGNKIIVTSRHSGWRGGIGATFWESEINELTHEQLSRFVNSWYAAVGTNKLTSKGKTATEKSFSENWAHEKSEELLRTINANDRIGKLSRNPLLLSMICFISYSKALPKERLSLYDDCSRLLLEQWDLEKGLPQDDIPLSLARKESIMGEIAYALHCGLIGREEQKEATGEEIVSIIRQALKRFGLDSDQANYLFDKLTNRTGLLIATEGYQGLFAFSHLSFQEYYTAKHIHSNSLDLFKVMGKSHGGGIDQITTWWREVVFLYSAMQKDISKVLTRLLIEDPDDIMKRKLQMAAQCRLESINLPRASIDKKLFEKLISIRTQGDICSSPLLSSSDLQNYLLHFAEQRQFHVDALSTFMKRKKTKEEQIEFEESLNKLLHSSDGNEVYCAAEIIYKYLDVNTITENINSELISKVTDNFHPQFFLSMVKSLCSNNINLLSAETIEVVSKKIAENFFSTTLEVYIDSSYVTDVCSCICETWMTLASDVFKNRHQAIKETLIKLLSEFLGEPPDYIRQPGILRRVIRYVLGYMVKLLLQIDNKEEQEIHVVQLLDMLSKGSYAQQTWALLIISDLDIVSKDVFSMLLAKKIHAPSKNLRIAAISLLGKTDLLSLDINPELVSSFHKRISDVPIMTRINEIIFGRGLLGSSDEERIYLAGVVSKLTPEIKLFNKLVLSQTVDILYERRWPLSDVVEDYGTCLQIDELHRLIDLAIEVDRLKESDILLFDTSKFISTMSEEIKSRVVHYLLFDSSHVAMDIISNLKPRIVKDSKECKLLVSQLSAKDFLDADSAFKILVNNSLV